MLIISYRASELDLEELSFVYREAGFRAHDSFYEDVYAYFSEHIGGYAVWLEGGHYVCALRFEPYRDGILISCLQTGENSRRKGYAQKLISSVCSKFQKPLYSHVEKKNIPSRKLHCKCGFEVISDTATLLDGTVTSRYETLRWKCC